MKTASSTHNALTHLPSTFRACRRFVSSFVLLSLGFFCQSGFSADDVPQIAVSQQLRHGPEVERKIDHLIDQMNLDEKISLVHANSKFTVAGIPRLGIPEMWMSDGPHGVREQIDRDSWNSANRDDDYATYLPPLTGVAASFNREMARLHGSVLGAEARHRGKDVILGPGMNLARNPLCGRNFEYLGEDPCLASAMAVAEIKAIQQQDVAACAKHFALNTQEWNRFAVDARPDEKTLREVYLPAFKRSVQEAGVLTIMGAYNQFRGTNCCQSQHLIQNILKGEWGFQGLVMTDWNCDINTRDAAMHGLDIEMGTEKPDYDDYYLARPLKEGIEQGEIPESVLDDKVRRVLRVQFAIGMYDDQRLPGARETPEHLAAARRIIEEGIVLLKNDNNVLPLNADRLKRVLVMGPNADTQHGRGGGSSQVKSRFEVTPLQGITDALKGQAEVTFYQAAAPADQGLRPIAPHFVLTRDSGAGTPAWKNLVYETEQQQKQLEFRWAPAAELLFDDDQIHHQRLIADVQPLESGIHTFQVAADGQFVLSLDGKTILEGNDAKREQIKTVEVELQSDKSYSVRLIFNGRHGVTLGWKAPGDFVVPAETYLQAARAADAVIYVGGLSHELDREAADRPHMQLPGNQDRTIRELVAANPNTVVLLVAGSAVELPWRDKAPAIVWGWYGGMHAGDAYADVLLGKVVPSGKMPFTLPDKLSDCAHAQLNDYEADVCHYKEGQKMGYRWFESQQIQPAFCFGHGLSYVPFEYSSLELSESSGSLAKPLVVTVNVTNVGDRSAAESVQVYVRGSLDSTDSNDTMEATRVLKGFQKAMISPQAVHEFNIGLERDDFSTWDINSNQWQLQPGRYQIEVGRSNCDIRQRAEITLTADPTPPVQ